jgi:hypothetical protein
MLKAVRYILAMLRWKIWRGLATIEPNYILAPSPLFYQVQETIALLLYSHYEIQPQILAETKAKIA